MSTFAALSFGGLFLLGTPPPASGASQVKSVLHEIMSRLRPGGLEQGSRAPKQPTKSKSASHSHRGGGNSRRREVFPVAQTRAPRAWDTAYQAAENDLRQGDPAVARPRFEALLATAPTRSERDLAEYRLLLLDLLEGREDTTVRFLTQAERLGKRSPAYFYLQAALARHRGQPLTAQRWATRAAGTSGQTAPADIRRRYADALLEPGSSIAEQNPLTGLTATTNPAASNPARVSMVEVIPATPALPQPGHDTAPAPAPTPALMVHRLTPGGLAAPSIAWRGEMTEGMPPASAAGPTPVPEASRRPEPAARAPREPASGSSSPAAPAAPIGKSIATAPLAIRDKFEAAQNLYTQRDLPGALRLVDEIETAQPNLTEVHNLRALLHYEVAYRQYIQQDYAGALRELDEADEAQAVADTSNLRGLVLARQKQYDRAEAAFRKAIAADPTLWAAKFNLADLPFGYRNYTEARQRFEALTAETDRTTQPRQAELTEFKVFLTLLLEGRESAARSFMSRFKADGSTPARLYAQAALDFRAGRFDRAIESVKDARKKYPPALEGIFAESFYRVGWLTDGTAIPGTSPADNAPVAMADAAPAASVAPTPEVTTTATPPPAPEPEATPMPVVVAAATPATTPTPVPAPNLPEPTPTVVAAVPTVTPAPTEPPQTVAAASEPPASPAATTSGPLPYTAIPQQTRSPSEHLVRDVLPWGILAYVLAPWLYAARMFLTRHRRRLRARRVVPLPRFPAADKVMGREKV